jgi:hypothetical protein
MEGDSEYHRMAKIRLFWSVYRLDKTLSLRLGHTPGLSEHDTPLPANPTVLRWVKLAVLQEKTFDQLLRTAALQLPSAERASNAACLASELQELIDETYQAEMVRVQRLPCRACTKSRRLFF